MKRILSIFIACIIILSISPQSNAHNTIDQTDCSDSSQESAFVSEAESLANMSESECIEFIKQRNIEIPKDYDEDA